MADGIGFVNGRRGDGGWATFVAERAGSVREAWFVTVRSATACLE
jgi:hypothetical protein